LCIESQIAEVERERAVLLEKLRGVQEVWAEVESTLTIYGASAVGELPPEVQKSITKKLTSLPAESELEFDLAHLEQMEAELATLIEQLSSKREAA